MDITALEYFKIIAESGSLTKAAQQFHITQPAMSAMLKKLEEGRSEPLMRITDDFHYHTVAADSEETLDVIEARLKETGFLAPLREYEPEDVTGR